MFRHLNLRNAWPKFRFQGLQNDGGALRLAMRPGALQLSDKIRSGIPFNAGLTGPAGIGIDSEGNIYLPDASGHQVLRWRSCDGVVTRLGCFGGEGSEPGQLKSPAAVLIGPRGALYVADTGNHRIQIFDLATLQLREIWGQTSSGVPAPANEVGRFNKPSDLTADSNGFIYVVDEGNRRIQKFSPDGRVIEAFWEQLKKEVVVPEAPASIATILVDDNERLLILDRARSRSRLLVYQTDGAFDDLHTRRWTDLVRDLPGGLVFISEKNCLAGVEARHGLVFDPDGKFLGAVPGQRAASARLLLDQQGRFLVQPGTTGIGSLALGQSFAETGNFLAGPFAEQELPRRWQGVKAVVEPLPANAHLQFFTYTSNDNAVPDWPPSEINNDIVQAGPNVWRAAPMDGLEFRIIHDPAVFLWIGAVFQGDGNGSPALLQIRLDYEHDGWLRYLPEIYAREDVRGTFLERSLATFESQLASVQNEIDDLPRLFDPWATTDQLPASWLDWLATWVAFDLDETWTPVQRRTALGSAFELLGRRGTVQGLREFISLYAGADVLIEEPARQASVWALAEEPSAEIAVSTNRTSDAPLGLGSLGFTTMLAAAEPQGAVLGTTATVDGSHIIDRSDYGAPLFEDLAHRFCVHVHASDVTSPGAMENLRSVIDREKPAHTTYQICVTEPLMRVGAQARLGVDAIIGGRLPDFVLDNGLQLGRDASLAAPEGLSRTIGPDARVGVGTRLA
jgi:phage tail-like protein